MNTAALKQRTPEWRQARIGLITGSIIGAVLGVSPFATPNAALKRMVREAQGDLDNFTNEAMQWGTDHEADALKLYRALYAGNAEVVETGLHVRGDLGASPDALVGEEGVLEVKCPFKLRNDVAPDFDSINDRKDYWHQCQLEMLCTGRQWCDFLQWTPHDHKLERINRDPNWLEENSDAIIAFMERYQEALAQAATGGPAERLANSEGWELAEAEYVAAKREVDEAAERLNAAKLALQKLVEANGLTECEGPGLKVSKVLSKGSIDYKKALATLMPETDENELEPFRRKDTTSWRFKEAN